MHQTHQLPLAVVIDEDILTRWCLQNYLKAAFRVVACRTLAEANEYLSDPHLSVVLWGNFITEVGHLALRRLAQRPDVRVITLVSDSEQPLPDGVAVVEKPFMLDKLDALLNLPCHTGSQDVR